MQTHAHSHHDMLLWPQADLYGIAILCGRSKGEECETINTSSLDCLFQTNLSATGDTQHDILSEINLYNTITPYRNCKRKTEIVVTWIYAVI